MCFSVNSSIFSYAMGMIAACFALYTRQYILGTLILCYCQVQLGEALIWQGIDTDDLELNRKGTVFIKYMLPAHLLFLGIGIAIFTKSSIFSFIPLLVGMVFFLSICVYYTLPSSIKDPNEPDVSFPAQRGCMKRECQNNDNRLQWPFHDKYYLVEAILIFVILYVFLPQKSAILLITFFVLTLIVSRVLYRFSASSMWCFLSAVLAPILVVMNYYVLRQK